MFKDWQILYILRIRPNYGGGVQICFSKEIISLLKNIY